MVRTTGSCAGPPCAAGTIQGSARRPWRPGGFSPSPSPSASVRGGSAPVTRRRSRSCSGPWSTASRRCWSTSSSRPPCARPGGRPSWRATRRTCSSRGSPHELRPGSVAPRPRPSAPGHPAGDGLAGRERDPRRPPDDLVGGEHRRGGPRLALRERAVGLPVPRATHLLLAVELRPEPVGLRIPLPRRLEAASERLLAGLQPPGVPRRAGLQRIELGDQAAHVAQLGELGREHVVDARRTRLTPERPDALRQQPRVVRLALGDDQVAGPHSGVRLGLRPDGVERGTPRLERTEDIQPLEYLVHGRAPYVVTLSTISITSSVWT